MRKIKMLNRISIDGYFASLNEESSGMDWFIHDPEVDIAAHEMSGQLNTLLMGGRTFRLFERSWVPILHDPDAAEHLKETARELTNMQKVVFSKQINSSSWENTRFHHDDLIGVAKRLKQEADSDILVLGSGSIVNQLASEGLIDEFLFIVTPIVAGQGQPLFPHTNQVDLKLLGVKTFASGNVLMHYGIGLRKTNIDL